MRSIRWLAALVIAVSIAAVAAETVPVIETRSVPPEHFPKTAAATHELRLSLYAFKNSRWQP
ncbi:MAG TPA: hypothetical protein VGO84_03480, partial [Burkholderiales bacterium]|nr:hypothetical protein [Burkholderiales bacterium]